MSISFKKWFLRKNKLQIIKIVLFACVFFNLGENSFSQQFEDKIHVYSLMGDTYILSFRSDCVFEMKIGKGRGLIVRGDYSFQSDTLIFVSSNMDEILKDKKDRKYRSIKYGFSRFLIFDSLLVPLALNTSYPISDILEKGSPVVAEYTLQKGGAESKLILFEDLTFNYSTENEKGISSCYGQWKRNNSSLILDTIKTGSKLNLICTKNQFIVMDNFIIGKETNENTGEVIYNYLLEMKSKIGYK